MIKRCDLTFIYHHYQQFATDFAGGRRERSEEKKHFLKKVERCCTQCKLVFS